MSASACKAWCGQDGDLCEDMSHACYSRLGDPCACSPECAEARRPLRPAQPAPSPVSLEPEWDAFVRARDAMAALLEKNGAPRASIVNLLNLDPPPAGAPAGTCGHWSCLPGWPCRPCRDLARAQPASSPGDAAVRDALMLAMDCPVGLDAWEKSTLADALLAKFEMRVK